MDLDGTLYRQDPMRARMVLELALLPLRAPARAPGVWRRLNHFRRERDRLRDVVPGTLDLERAQYERAAARTGETAETVRRTVDEWMHERPLKYLAACRSRGLPEFLRELAARGIECGCFSDYPVTRKLEALGIAQHFSVRLCATDADVNAFKPHPQGFLRACEHWGLEPAEVLYVGDRPHLDGQGARNAGMRAAILGKAADGDAFPTYDGFPALAAALFG